VPSALDHVKKFRAAISAVLVCTTRLGRASIPSLSKRSSIKPGRFAPGHPLVPSALKPYLMRTVGQPEISSRNHTLGPRGIMAGPELPAVRGRLPAYESRPGEPPGRGDIIHANKAAAGWDKSPGRPPPPHIAAASVPGSSMGTAAPASHLGGMTQRRPNRDSTPARLPLESTHWLPRSDGANGSPGRSADWHDRQSGYAPMPGPTHAPTRFRGLLAPLQGTAYLGQDGNIGPGRQNSVGSLEPPLGENAGLSQAGSVGVIHLDGNVLGQWVIDHLERSLSKPSTGTTGLNPRASMNWIGSPLLT
jgi:hypothetical protein